MKALHDKTYLINTAGRLSAMVVKAVVNCEAVGALKNMPLPFVAALCIDVW